MGVLRRPEPWVFAILLGSYAYFWQSRDWNSASRLMLTYALVDRGTIALNGLEDQTHDRAYFGGRFLTDKLPGFSFLAVPVYAAARAALRLPDHPLGQRGFAHWPADYWVTLGTSGVLTAATGALLCFLTLRLGAGPGRGALIGLAYGLGTPAYVYATLSYGHQATAFALLASLALIWLVRGERATPGVTLAGFLASYAAVIELQVGPVSAVLGFYLVGQVLTRRRRAMALGEFALGALVPALLLLGYNVLAFGTPWDMGYFHHTTAEFARVHSAENPLGLSRPDAARALSLLWGRYRGLFFYAPVVALAPPGWVSLGRAREWGVLGVSVGATGAVFLVNLSYPEWTGGWSTGPRLLLPLLPFTVLAVGAWVARGGFVSWTLAWAAALAGGVLMTLFNGVGGRVPQYFSDPLVQVVLPTWTGRVVPGWPGEPFARNAASVLFPEAVRGLPASARALQFAPLVLAQALALVAMSRVIRRKVPGPADTAEVRPGN